ncbi:MAG: M36 family metallopeptidase [Acidiferrobacterales bacterium]
MSRELDRRDFSRSRITNTHENVLNATAAALSETLPGRHRIHIARFDPGTGNPSLIRSQHAPSEPGNYVKRALDHVRGIRGALGLVATQLAEYAADPDYQRTSSGAVAVHLHQLYHGIPVFCATETVRFTPDGGIKETVGSSVTVDREPSIATRMTVQEAVLVAARHVAAPDEQEAQGGAKDEFGEPLSFTSIDLSDFEPKVIAAYPEKPDHSTVLEAGPFEGAIKASLVWFPLDGNLRLAWEVMITQPGYSDQYRTLVDAQDGAILYCRQTVQHVTARGSVFRVDGGGGRQMTDFPRQMTDYGLPVPNDLPGTFPDDWVENDLTEGNNVEAHLGISGPSMPGDNDNGTIVFNPADPTGDEQKVLNIFYFSCVMHDYFYLLGFREADGNFQRDNLGRGGLPMDRVDARAHSGAVNGTANMATPIDGARPIMNMGLVTSTGRHTAFDSSVVFHEFTHGVTNRLVGGPADSRALENHQSSGMGEGWSDYFASTINDQIVVGDWVTGNPNGIRGFPYNSNFPDNFGDLGTGRYSGFQPDGRRWPHPLGEIWCATLLEMNRNIGKELGAQLVLDALKLMSANPGFLDARDAILEALNDKRDAGQMSLADYETNRNGCWQAFAQFGMGVNAQSNGASLSGIVADFNMPGPIPPVSAPDVQVSVSPDLAIPDNQQAGANSTLQVTQAGRIAQLTLGIDIQHTYIGDLQVSLAAPGGAVIMLHKRTGSNTQNLVTTYSTDDVLALQALIGESALGDWTLHIADRAPIDTGILRRWELAMDLEVSTQMVAQGEDSPGTAIPDNDPTGVSSSINIAQSGNARGLIVSVDITHTYIGDLRIELTAPSGQQVVLHNQSGSDEDNLIRTYDSVSIPALAGLIGESIQGAWQLRVADLLGQDIGKFNHWSLELAT